VVSVVTFKIAPHDVIKRHNSQNINLLYEIHSITLNPKNRNIRPKAQITTLRETPKSGIVAKERKDFKAFENTAGQELQDFKGPPYLCPFKAKRGSNLRKQSREREFSIDILPSVRDSLRVKKRRTLEPEATVRFLSLVLACGFFSVVMVIAGAVHILCYEGRKPKVRAVLHGQKKPADIDYNSV